MILIRRNQILSELKDGAFRLARKKERNPETAMDWAQDALLKACIEFERYQHLPDGDVVKLLGMVVRNHILQLQRREVEKDKRENRLDENFETSPLDKVMDDGHYEPFVHHIQREYREPNYYPPDEFEGQDNFVVSRELMSLLLKKCNDRETSRFLREKLNPSTETRKLMEESGVEHPYDSHIFPTYSKATISRVKNRIRKLVGNHAY